MGHLRKANAPFEQKEHFEGFKKLGWQTIELGRWHRTVIILENLFFVL